MHPDYHVDLDRRFTSVPNPHRGHEVWIRATARTVEMMLKGKRFASHAYSQKSWQYSTLAEHMPTEPLHVACNTVDGMRERAARIGPNAMPCFHAREAKWKHPVRAIKSCQGAVPAGRLRAGVG